MKSRLTKSLLTLLATGAWYNGLNAQAQTNVPTPTTFFLQDAQLGWSAPVAEWEKFRIYVNSTNNKVTPNFYETTNTSITLPLRTELTNHLKITYIDKQGIERDHITNLTHSASISPNIQNPLADMVTQDNQIYYRYAFDLSPIGVYVTLFSNTNRDVLDSTNWNRINNPLEKPRVKKGNMERRAYLVPFTEPRPSWFYIYASLDGKPPEPRNLRVIKK